MSGDQHIEYAEILADLKSKIRAAQQRASVKVNSELLVLYWEIGKTILEQQERLGWGAKVIKQLSADLKEDFPEMKGLSERNLKYMRAFAEAYPDFQMVQGTLAQTGATSKNEFVQCSLAITNSLAKSLQDLLGIESSFWLNQEEEYRNQLIVNRLQ